MEFKAGDIAIIDLRGDQSKFSSYFCKYDGDLVEIVAITDNDFYPYQTAKIRLLNGDYFDWYESKRECLTHNTEYLRHANIVEPEEFDYDEGVIL